MSIDKSRIMGFGSEPCHQQEKQQEDWFWGSVSYLTDSVTQEFKDIAVEFKEMAGELETVVKDISPFSACAAPQVDTGDVNVIGCEGRDDLTAERAPKVSTKFRIEDPNGICFRRSKNLNDKKADWGIKSSGPSYGDVVQGIDEGDDWIKVGNFYLPKAPNGKLVVMPVSEVHEYDLSNRNQARQVPLATAKDVSTRSEAALSGTEEIVAAACAGRPAEGPSREEATLEEATPTAAQASTTQAAPLEDLIDIGQDDLLDLDLEPTPAKPSAHAPPADLVLEFEPLPVVQQGASSV